MTHTLAHCIKKRIIQRTKAYCVFFPVCRVPKKTVILYAKSIFLKQYFCSVFQLIRWIQKYSIRKCFFFAVLLIIPKTLMTLLQGSGMFTNDEFPNIPMTFQYPAPPYMLPELGNPIWSDFDGKHKPCMSKEQKVCFSWYGWVWCSWEENIRRHWA